MITTCFGLLRQFIYTHNGDGTFQNYVGKLVQNKMTRLFISIEQVGIWEEGSGVAVCEGVEEPQAKYQ